MPHSDSGAPLVKRQKRAASTATAQSTSSAIATGSNIFAPYRTVGLVSPTGVPFTSIPLGKTTFQITTSVGRCLQTYDLKRGLQLVFVTRPQTPRDITATCAWKRRVYAAWGGGVAAEEDEDEDEEPNNDEDNDEDNDADEDANNKTAKRSSRQGVWIFQRGRKVGELPLPADLDEPIRQLIVFGNWIVGLATTRIEVWKTVTQEHYTTLQPTATTAGSNHLTGGMCTMPTFLNKLFVGRADGWVEIWNVSSGKLIYTILPPPTETSPGGVTCLEPTPALGLLAIAYAAGPLVIHDVLRDQPLVYVEAGTPTSAAVFAANDGIAPVTSISFRTDGRGAGPDGRAEGVMATATTASGDVTFWDLNKGGRIMGVLRSAHNPPSGGEGGGGQSVVARDGRTAIRGPVAGGISRVQFLPGQPVILTSGRDNALKSWMFDETPFSPVPRYLHARSGHAAPVNCLGFLPSDFDGADGGNKWLLSGGLDRSLWGWSLRRDGQSTELSQGHVRQRAQKAGLLSAAALRHGPTTLLEDLKAPPITCIASSLNRDGGIGALPGRPPTWMRIGPKGAHDAKHKGDAPRPRDAEAAALTGWESVVTAHHDDAWARTWFWGRKRAGRWAFVTSDQQPVTTVAISPCGTFALLGSAAGAIDMYNLQSGIYRQRFPSKLTPAQARQLKVQQQLRQADGVAQLQAKATMGGAGDAGGSGASGLFSGAFKSPGAGRHTRAVTGLVVDALNTVVVSCSLDGSVKFWDFLTGHLVDEIPAAAWGHVPITACRYHAPNDLLAFACADGTIRVVDLETRRTIRVLRAGRVIHVAPSTSAAAAASPPPPPPPINDLCFSADGRWVLAVTQRDARLRVWDLPTSHLIDSVVLDRPGRALAVSGSGEYLAVAPEGALGVHLWTNKTLFRHVPTRPVVEDETAASGVSSTPALPAARVKTKKARVIQAPTASGEGGTNLLDGAFADDADADADADDADYVPPAAQLDQLSADMTTLSLVPRARWQTLLHIDLIKQRNRPKEAPKAPEKAPFFLGTVGSAEAETAAGLAAAYPAQSGSGGGSDDKNTVSDQVDAAANARSRILTLDHTRMATMSALTRKLHQNDTSFVEHLKGLPPAQADLELRSLSADDGELTLFVVAMTRRLRERRDYELVQAWMAVFLRLHGAAVVEADADASGGGDDDLVTALAEYRTVQEQERRRLDALVGYCGGVINFLRNPRT